MLYSILIYGSEARVGEWTPEQEAEVMGRHVQLRQDLTAAGRLGPVMRLAKDGGRTIRGYRERSYVTDGPYAETKEQLMGLYIVDCATLDEAAAAAERLSFETGVFEIRPITWFDPGVLPPERP